MNKCRVELSDMELELLRLRRDSSSKASQLSQMETTLKETKGMLDKKSEMGMHWYRSLMKDYIILSMWLLV